MLSNTTNSPQGISRRRMQHRRQLSTPNALEMPSVLQRPASPTRPMRPRHNRSGMSLDLRGLNLESVHAPSPGPYQQEHGALSFTNHLGQSSQQPMQVAQPHSMPQPGPQEAFLQSPVQLSPRCRSPQSPLRSPIYRSRPHSPISHNRSRSLSPNKAPTEQQLKDLHEHIQSVYGSCGQVFINILPTPTVAAAPQAVIPEKPAQLPSHQSFGMAPHPTNFNDMADINLRPTSRSMGFDYEHPDQDGYESPGSVYYGSDVSPSPQASPRMKIPQPFLQGITEDEETTPFSHMPTLLPALEPHSPVHGSSPIHAIPNSLPLAPNPYDEVPLAPSPYDEVPLYNDLEIDATVEFTGISSEEVQRYISEQDPKTNKWTCLYQDCGKIFGRRENIRSHVQTHLGDRQYKCNGCGKCFVRQHDLKRHAKIHSGNKPYKCPCGAGFARQDALTRHRQRGMCVGGFADAVRRQAKRGRPKKQRPEMEERVAKSSRTRRALASAASSEAGSSPNSDGRSPYESFEAPLQNFNEPLNTSTDPFSFEPQSSPYHETDREDEFARAASYTSEAASINLLRQLSNEPAQTPPLSPGYRHLSREPVLEPVPERKQSHQPSQPSPLKVTESPSRSSVKSQGFTTPPTSPIEPQDELEELFDIRQEPSLSQFDLEMRAMSDFTAVDNNNYDFLDFSTV